MKSFIPIISVLAGFLILSSLGENRGKPAHQSPPTAEAAETTDAPASDTTDLGGVHFTLGEIVRSDNRITAVSLELLNTNPGAVTVIRHTLKNGEGEELLENNDPIAISPETSVAWAVGFPKPPTQEQFEQFTVEWELESLGETYLKTNRIADPDSTGPKME